MAKISRFVRKQPVLREMRGNYIDNEIEDQVERTAGKALKLEALKIASVHSPLHAQTGSDVISDNLVSCCSMLDLRIVTTELRGRSERTLAGSDILK